MGSKKEYFGEFVGTLVLVLFGCGAVASAVLFDAFHSLLEVAVIWGGGVAIAIFTVRNICPAHLNPAVSIGMCLAHKLSIRKLPLYVLSQVLGAFCASLIIYLIFKDSIVIFESANGIVRGSAESFQSAMMFGEYFPNPGFNDAVKISPLGAGVLEGFGTFILVFVIFRLTEKETQINNATPILIGLTVTLLICLIAPFTQGGFNPARDFAPRVVAYFAGWRTAAFPTYPLSFLTVYIIGPCLGGVLARYAHKFMQEP